MEDTQRGLYAIHLGMLRANYIVDPVVVESFRALHGGSEWHIFRHSMAALAIVFAAAFPEAAGHRSSYREVSSEGSLQRMNCA